MKEEVQSSGTASYDKKDHVKICDMKLDIFDYVAYNNSSSALL